MGKPVILLYGLTEGCGLIIPYPSGVIFCNQVGGIQCFQAKLEGVYVPLDWRGVERAMENIFDGVQ